MILSLRFPANDCRDKVDYDAGRVDDCSPDEVSPDEVLLNL